MKILLSTLFLLLLSDMAGAVCSSPVSHYTSYHSEYADYAQSRGFVMTVSSSVNGYSSGMDTCQYGITHTPKAKMLLTESHTGRQIGGWLNGTPGCPSCQISVINTNSTGIQSGDDWTADDESSINCSRAGQFWLGLTWYTQFEIAVTLTQDEGQPGFPGPRGKTYFYVANFCSAASSPPDLTVYEVLSATRWNYWLSASFCFRIKSPGIPWICASNIAEVIHDPYFVAATPTLPWASVSYNCTNKDRGISGIPFPWPF